MTIELHSLEFAGAFCDCSPEVTHMLRDSLSHSNGGSVPDLACCLTVTSSQRCKALSFFGALNNLPLVNFLSRELTQVPIQPCEFCCNFTPALLHLLTIGPELATPLM